MFSTSLVACSFDVTAVLTTDSLEQLHEETVNSLLHRSVFTWNGYY